jgi:hypothetical protein
MAIDYRSEYPQVTEEARRRLQLIEQTQGPAQVKAEIDRLNGSGNRRPAATTNLSDLTIDSPNNSRS